MFKKSLLSSSSGVPVALTAWRSTDGNSGPNETKMSNPVSRGLEFEFPNPTSELPKNDRGLVVSVPVKVEGQKLKVMGRLDVQELRFALLFWDRLDFPENSFMSLGGGPEFDYLIAAGVAQRSFARLDGGGDGAAISKAAHVAAFRNLDRQQPGVWSLSRGVNSVAFEEDDLDVGRGLLFKLHRALPVPDREVPLADVLKFKESRKAELLALRSELEEVFQQISLAPDRALAEGTEFTKLERAIKDHFNAIRSAGIPTRLASLTTRLDLRDFVAAAGPTAAAYSQGLDAVSALLTGAAGVGINVGFGLKGRTPSSPFEFISTIHDRLF